MTDINLEEIKNRVAADENPDLTALIAEVERLQAQIGVVRTLHEPIEALNTTVNRVQKVCLGCGQDNGNWQNWPCPTTRALEDPAATRSEAQHGTQPE